MAYASRNPMPSRVNLKRARVVDGHPAFASGAQMACRLLVGDFDTFFAELKLKIGRTDGLVFGNIVAEAPNDMAARTTNRLSGSDLEHAGDAIRTAKLPTRRGLVRGPVRCEAAYRIP